MKTFVLALTLLAPDGSTTKIPVELWQFSTMAECTKSSLFMNKGRVAAAKNYSCVEYDPSRNVAKVIPPQPAKSNS